MSQIFGTITSIKHKAFLIPKLKELTFVENLNFNLLPSVFILNTKRNKYAVAKWVSPKRTRSYPFARVYNTLGFAKKISIIALVKDEGAAGERDFLQFDTVSLLSLLDVYVIIAYYDCAKKVANKQKITKQQFCNQYLQRKIAELESFHSSALHWNLAQLEAQNLAAICNQTISSYNQISSKTGVKLHSNLGIEKFKIKIMQEITSFKEFSRSKALQAQNREYKTIQPKEQLSSISKAKITLTNYLGGKYFLTADEIKISAGQINLIESKHSAHNLLPNLADIKDGLLKIILYANLKNAQLNDGIFTAQAVLKLTSNKISGSLNSNEAQDKISYFLQQNKFKPQICNLVKVLFKGAKENNFLLEITQI